MSTAVFTATGSFDPNDHALAAFLASVPAAADYDRAELFEGRPSRPHRPARPTEKRQAIKRSLDINGPYRTGGGV